MGVSIEIGLAVLCADAGRCFYCGNLANGVDHIDSLKAGGSDQPENLIAACATCNGVKGDRPLPAALRHEAKVTVCIRANLIWDMAREARAAEERAKDWRALHIAASSRSGR